MTIKEIEEKTGMSRANIRYYESEGLLHPVRTANGYRDYSETDEAELKKIRLLRALGLSLEEIRRVQSGERHLEDALSQLEPRLEREQQRLTGNRAVCAAIRQDGVEYAALEPTLYLGGLETSDPPASDQLPRVRSPWRRYFARMLDLRLYRLVVTVLLTLLTTVNLTGPHGMVWQILWMAVSLLLMLLVEPVLLHVWGTTPGKWLLGLAITDGSGGRLPLRQARYRTWSVLCKGLGLELPVYSLVRLWKSCHACTGGEPLPWEEDSTLVLRDRKPWRAAAFLAVAAVTFGITTGAVLYQKPPRNRGPLTVEEYAENVTALSEDWELYQTMNSDGTWCTGENDLLYGLCTFSDPVLTVEDGQLTELRWELNDDGKGAPVGVTIQQVLALALVQARQSPLELRGVAHELRMRLEEHGFENWSGTYNGVRVTCQADWSGYEKLEQMLWPMEGEEQTCHLVLKLELAE